MKRKRGIFSLMDDCQRYRQNDRESERTNMQPIHQYKTKADEEVTISKPVAPTEPVQEPHSVASSHYDDEAGLSLSYDEAQSYYRPEEFTDDLDYYVEPFTHDDTDETYVSSHSSAVPPKENNAGQPYTEKPAPATLQPEQLKQLIEDDSAFQAEIKAIQEAQKQRKAQRPATAQNRIDQRLQQRSRQPETAAEQAAKNEHAIFEKIAQSMQLATSYDLGAIQLEQRFDDFEQEMTVVDPPKKKQ